jgi:glutathione S-transferase
MTDFELFIGDKQLSSWSLRPWLAMRHAGVPFIERQVRLDRPESAAALRAASPSGLVPALAHRGLVVWDSLAILEYVAEQRPSAGLWPDDSDKRAIARSVSAEMHSGFAALRRAWPMQFASRGLNGEKSDAVMRDLARIDALWTLCRTRHGAGGPFLFGRFSIADAMYAPVASRIETYGPAPLSAPAAEWRQMMMALPAMQSWGRGAEAELAGE